MGYDDAAVQERLEALGGLYRKATRGVIRGDSIGWQDFALAAQTVPNMLPMLGLNDILAALPMSDLFKGAAVEEIELTRFAPEGEAALLTKFEDGEFPVASLGSKKAKFSLHTYGTKTVITTRSIQRSLLEGVNIITSQQQSAAQVLATKLRKVLWCGDGNIYGMRNIAGVPSTTLSQPFSGMTFAQAMTAIATAQETVRLANYLKEAPNRLFIAPSIFTVLGNLRHETTNQSVLEALAAQPVERRMEVREIKALDATGSAGAAFLIYYDPGAGMPTFSVSLPQLWGLYGSTTDGLSNTSYYTAQTGGIVATNFSPEEFSRYYVEP